MNNYQYLKHEFKSFFIEGYNVWVRSKGEFLLDFFLLTCIVFVIILLGSLAIWGFIAGAIAIYNAIRDDILILLYIISGIAVVIGVPTLFLFLGKHFKANE